MILSIFSISSSLHNTLHNTYVYIIFIVLQINEKIMEMKLMDQYSVSCLPTGPNIK